MIQQRYKASFATHASMHFDNESNLGSWNCLRDVMVLFGFKTCKKRVSG
jgi:hypothetical protein